jgi:hypothetical protein
MGGGRFKRRLLVVLHEEVCCDRRNRWAHGHTICLPVELSIECAVGNGQDVAEEGRVYSRQTGRSVDTRLKEHQWRIRLKHPDKVYLLCKI